VIVFSGYEDRETVDRAIEAGAWGYIAKDLTTQEVFAAIRRVSEGHFVLPAI
jgi:DNA-binding NarL/FixJ family response regulator